MVNYSNWNLLSPRTHILAPGQFDKQYSRCFLDSTQITNRQQWLTTIKLLKWKVALKSYVSVRPRLVEQTSVHEILKSFGQSFKVPSDVCRIIHVRVPLQGGLTREQLNVDKRLWDFHEKLTPMVDRVLKRVGLLGSEGQSWQTWNWHIMVELCSWWRCSQGFAIKMLAILSG